MVRTSVAILLLGASLVSAHPLDSPGCKWTWGWNGCAPKPDCVLQWKPRLGTFGPCVNKTASVAEECDEPASAVDASPAEEAEAAPAEAEPAPAVAEAVAEPAPAEPAESEPAPTEPEAASEEPEIVEEEEA